MDSTSRALPGQQPALRDTTVQEIGFLCELMQYIRAWWKAFEATIEKLDRAASIKAHDAMIDAVILARRIARDLGITLPDFDDQDWSTTCPPAGRPTACDL